MKTEPLLIRGAICAAITALIHVLVLLGALPIAPDVEGSIAGLVDLAGTAVLVVWSRGAVSPVRAESLSPELAPAPSEAPVI